jgi:hypothetical protein
VEQTKVAGHTLVTLGAAAAVLAEALAGPWGVTVVILIVALWGGVRASAKRCP